MGSQPRSAVEIGSGALATERALIDCVRGLCDAAREDPAQLARPVRVVVPSQSLREHLAAQLVRALGGGVAGVLVQTSRRAAFDVLRAAGVAGTDGRDGHGRDRE